MLMQGRIFGYSAVYFLAFCFFSVVFHAFAAANTFPENVLKKQGENEFEQSQKVTQIIPSPTNKQVPTATSAPTIPPTQAPTITPTPTQTPSPTPYFVQPAPGELEGLFQKYADEYHVDRELMKRIAACESSFNTQADTGKYAGMFQFAEQTWVSTRIQMGLDSNPEIRKNAEEAIRTAAYMVSLGRQGAWANCLP